MDDVDGFLDEEAALGVEGLALEVIMEEPDDHLEYRTVSKGRHSVRQQVYDYEAQVEAFKESVNEFMDDKQVFSVDTQTVEVEDDRYRNEARIVYSEGR